MHIRVSWLDWCSVELLTLSINDSRKVVSTSRRFYYKMGGGEENFARLIIKRMNQSTNLIYDDAQQPTDRISIFIASSILISWWAYNNLRLKNKRPNVSLCCFLRNVELVEDRQRWSDASERRSIPNCDWNKWRWDVQRSTNSWDAIDPFSSRNDVPSGSNANWWQLEMDLMIAFAPFDLPPIYNYITFN